MLSKTSLIVTCHPSPTSLCGRVAERIADTLKAAGRHVIVDDLAALRFNPVISPDEYRHFYSPAVPDDVADLAAHLSEARELVFVLPIWMYDMPAILKGYFERVWRPNVAYRMEGGEVVPLMGHITRLTAVVSHGRGEEETALVGDATRRFFETSITTLLPNLTSNARFDFYALDAPDPSAIEGTMTRVCRHFEG